ncbi:MAG: hypothetical protein AAGJ52_02565, partial [Pseudomonadota bacterium]
MTTTRQTRSITRLITAMAALVLSSASWAQSLVYEREFTFFGEVDNTLRITLTADNTLLVERPAFMT